MNGAHFHLIVNHFPVVGLFFALTVLFLAMLRKSEDGKFLGAGLIVFCALMGGVAYFSGEAAEEVLEQLPGFEEVIVEAHEEAALWALILMALSGCAAGYGVFWAKIKKSNFPDAALKAALILGIIASLAAVRTANLGGQISHKEIRSSPAQPH